MPIKVTDNARKPIPTEIYAQDMAVGKLYFYRTNRDTVFTRYGEHMVFFKLGDNRITPLGVDKVSGYQARGFHLCPPDIVLTITHD